MITRYIVLGLLLVGCVNKNQNKHCNSVLAETFLQVVDTFGYKTFSLRPALPADTLNYRKAENTGKQPAIIVSDSLLSFEAQLKKIKPVINSSADSSKEFFAIKDIVDNNREGVSCFSTNELSNNFPKKIGNFSLVFSRKGHSVENQKQIGTIQFSNVVNLKDSRYFMYYIVISDGIKSGIEKLVLVENSGNYTKVLKEIDIYVW